MAEQGDDLEYDINAECILQNVDQWRAQGGCSEAELNAASRRGDGFIKTVGATNYFLSKPRTVSVGEQIGDPGYRRGPRGPQHEI